MGCLASLSFRPSITKDGKVSGSCCEASVRLQRANLSRLESIATDFADEAETGKSKAGKSGLGE